MVGVVSAKNLHSTTKLAEEMIMEYIIWVANICPNIIYNVESDQYDELTEN